MLITNCALTPVYLLAGSRIQQQLPSYPAWGSPTLALIGFVNFLLALALWSGRLWALWGIVVTTLLTTIVNWTAMGFVPALVGLVSGLFNLAILSLLFTIALAYPRSWQVDGETSHVVRVEHEAILTGRVYLFLDDRVIFRRWNKFWDTGLEHEFDVAGKHCRLRIAYKLWYYDYGLWVDGVRQMEVAL
jgi:hypothetical protein